MSAADFLVVVLAEPSPSPSPNDPTSTVANAALSNYLLAVGILVAAVVVIVLALLFAFGYHWKLLDVIRSAVTTNAQPLSGVNENATPFDAAGVAPEIIGPGQAAPAASLLFAVKNLDGVTVTWTALGASPPSGAGLSFATIFETAGSFQVKAAYTDPATSAPQELIKAVTIAATEPAPTPGAIALPFVVRNWGRLVVVIFGVGVIGALMSSTVLDAAAGVGILGTLLGVGAVGATSGSSGDRPGAPPT